MVNVTVPVPLPDEGLVSEIQSALFDVAVHAQPPAAVIDAEPGPPDASTFSEFGAMLNEHAAAWLTVKVWPAIVKVPVRAAPAFGATLNATDPFPLPDAPLVIVSQSGFAVVTVQVQPFAATTFTLPAPPLEPTAWLLDEIVGLQPFPCETVNVCPAIVNVPVRGAPALAATLYPTDPFPLPDVPLVIVSQSELFVDAVQVQPFAAEIVTVPVPPLAPIAWLLDEIAGSQPLACDSVNVCPAIDTLPERAGPAFAANE
jgi:hypothetical protein